VVEEDKNLRGTSPGLHLTYPPTTTAHRAVERSPACWHEDMVLPFMKPLGRNREEIAKIAQVGQPRLFPLFTLFFVFIKLSARIFFTFRAHSSHIDFLAFQRVFR